MKNKAALLWPLMVAVSIALIVSGPATIAMMGGV